MTDILPFSAACERNKDVILDTLASYFPHLDSILEIGSGTAQHATHFAKAYPNLLWQTSDQQEYIDGILSQLKYAGLDNVLKPLVIDVNQKVWSPEGVLYSAVYSANTLHIMTEGDVVAFFDGLVHVTKNDASLFVYGPFKYEGKFTSESNYEFDQALRARGCGSAIRDIEFVESCAKKSGFVLRQDHKMPANNQLLIFQKQA